MWQTASLSRIAVIGDGRSERPQGAHFTICCGAHILAKRADCGHSLRLRVTHAVTLEADIQATLKFGFSLHRRMTAKSPERHGEILRNSTLMAQSRSLIKLRQKTASSSFDKFLTKRVSK